MERIKKVADEIKNIDQELIKKAKERLDNLTKPLGSLGRLEELAAQIVGIKSEFKPKLKRKVIFLMAADHGVVKEGVSAYPQEVTQQMVYNFLNGGAGINVLARYAGADVKVIDIGVANDLKEHPLLLNRKIGYGTKNMAEGPAMEKDQAIKSIETGIELFEEEFKKGLDIIGTGDMGIGNTTPSSAIASVITGRPVEELTGRGTGIDDSTLSKKIETIKKAININKPDPNDPIDTLAKVGGFEIGGLAGVILASAARRVPIVIDGFISGAATLIAVGLEPKVKDFLIAAHCSAERGHRIVLEHLGLRPILNLDMRLGEGTGSALAMLILEASLKIFLEMATFQEAGVSKKSE